ncbi:Quinolinate synthase, Protein A [Leptospira biflexa serovar Patoc strain 'Patoc 1 (Ames)']|uniref:Quinolinate synthase n=1 Tax=Leptospira biflexa serovar Patoc (strain Patoc 1 / ATCC 23582 / Paris) TaxID=456481 RepID=B0SJL6_LEPBP|nr:quinolinate synthase NadA [Leptospira biflexa]ABZ92858.1 Quinolinate synthase, Protein A [Leptospira biflexa serovar Patoc strain 'Patoc 1 (Ames)']ABZ96465.1 Quinolinate synthetase A protein [Leptospira biflexa serovar Patoc strain 'Patoc 1 (Paris)']
MSLVSKDQLVQKLKPIYLPHEIEERILPLAEEIGRLKKEKNAVILGHNYMTPDVFWGVSDIIGDSLYLSKMAKETTANMILFNGVHFMAETAKILSPEKKVLIADPKAGCSLAESITREDVKVLKAKYPGVPVVTYVNCSAEVKAETDVCCTSANAVQIVNAVEGDTVIFLPDEYLAGNVRNQTSKTIISHPGRCMVHEIYTPEDIRSTKRLFPGGVTVITHPECHEDVVKEADFSGSTSQMVDFIRNSKTDKIMLVTECSMGDNLRSEFPEKEFVSTCQTCPHMKKITLEKVRDALLKEQFEIFLDEEVIRLAQKSVNRMLELSYKK